MLLRKSRVLKSVRESFPLMNEQDSTIDGLFLGNRAPDSDEAGPNSW